MQRALAILRRRGEIPDLAVDGRLIELQYRSPLAQAQANRDVQATLLWLQAAAGLGPVALGTINVEAAAHWLGTAFGVPGQLIRATPVVPSGTGGADVAAAATPARAVSHG